MSRWPKPDEQADLSEIQAQVARAEAWVHKELGIDLSEWQRRVLAGLIPFGAAHRRRRSTAMRKADQQRARAVGQIEKELRREAQREGGGSWT